MERPPGTDTRPTSSEVEPGPAKQQFLRIRGKTPSPPWKNRVIVVDPDRGTVEVQNEKSIAKGMQTMETTPTFKATGGAKIPAPSRRLH